MEPLLTYKEAFQFCGFKSKRPLQLAVRNKELQKIEFGYKNIRFERRELLRWIEGKKNRIIRVL